MDEDPDVSLRIPDLPPDFLEGDPYAPVPHPVLHYTIELLQCFVAQWRDLQEGKEADDRVWGRLGVSAAYALAGLLDADTAYENQDHAAALVQQISLFCYQPGAAKRLKAVPASRYGADAIDALIALSEQNQRRRGQQKEQPPAAEQAPAAERDPGWEF